MHTGWAKKCETILVFEFSSLLMHCICNFCSLLYRFYEMKSFIVCRSKRVLFRVQVSCNFVTVVGLTMKAVGF